MSYTPPGLPLDVTWEGTAPYTAPTMPLDVSWESAGETITGTFAVTIPAPTPPTFPVTLAASLDNIQTATGAISLPAPVTGNLPGITLAATMTQDTALVQDVDGPRVGERSRHLTGRVTSRHGGGWHEAIRVSTPGHQPHQHGDRLAKRCSYPSAEMLRIRRANWNQHQHGLKLRRGMTANASEASRTSRTIRERYTEAIRITHGTGFPWFETIKLRNRSRHDHAQAIPRADPLRWHIAEAIRTQTPLHQPWTHMIWPAPGRWWPFYVPPGLNLVIPCSGDYTPRPLECTVLLHWEPIEQPYCPGIDPEPPGPGGPIIITAGRVLLMVHDLQIYRTSDGAIIDADNIQLEIDAESWAWGFNAQLLSAEAYDRVQPTVDGPVDLTIQIDGQAFRFLAETTMLDRKNTSKPARMVSGRGRSALLGDPYSHARSRTEATGKTAQQLATDELQFTGWTLEWAPPDWFVPGGVWSYPSHTPIAAIIDVAQSIGAFVAPDPATDTLRIISRFPEAPWNWATSIPDYIIEANPIKGITQRWGERPEFNKAWALGEEQGVIVSSTRTGTAGDRSAPQAIHPLITHVDAGRERGRVELSKGGKRLEVTLTMPYMGGAYGPGLIVPGKLLEVEDPRGTWRGLVQGVKILATQTSVEQVLTIDRRL